MMVGGLVTGKKRSGHRAGVESGPSLQLRKENLAHSLTENDNKLSKGELNKYTFME